MNTVCYIRRDDAEEKVFITSQARSPDGPIHFEFAAPAHHRGKTGTLSGPQFHRDYKLEREPAPKPPQKPLSTDSKDDWRAWALHMEQKYKEADASYRRVCAMDKTGNTW